MDKSARKTYAPGPGVIAGRSLLLALLAAAVFLAAPNRAAAADAAHQQFVFAYRLLQKGEDHLAADAFDQYLGDFPHAPMGGDARYFRALLYHRAGDDKHAAKMLASVPAPQLVPLYAVRLLRGQVLTDLHQPRKAVAVLERIDTSKLKPNVVVAVAYLKGLAYRQSGNLQAAQASLAAAAKAQTSLAGQALLDLARVQVQMNHKDRAVATLAKALKYDQVAAAAAHLAGDLYYDLGNYEKAITFYQHVIADHQSSPDFAPAVVGVLWSHFSAGRYQQVASTWNSYHKLLSGAPKATAAYLAGSAQQNLGHPHQAAALLDIAAQDTAGDDPSIQPRALYKLAQCRLALKDYAAVTRTADQLRRRFAKSPMAAKVVFLQAQAQAAQGHVATSAAMLTGLIRRGPHSPIYRDALLQRARLYEDHSSFAAAVTDYKHFIQTAGRLGDDEQQAFLHWIDIDYRLGDYAAVVKAAKQLLARKNIDPLVAQQALYRQALALIKTSQPKGALTALKSLDARFPANPYRSQSVYYRGLLRMSLNQADQARPLLARSANDKHLDKTLRANALRLLVAQQRQNKQPAAAAGTLSRLIDLAGLKALNADQLLYLSAYRVSRDQARQALVSTHELLQNRGNATAAQQARALYLAGQAHRALRQFAAAKKDFQHVIALGQGDDLKAGLALGQTLAAQGHDQAALNEFDGLIAVNSDRIAAQALYHSARIYRRLAQRHRRAQEPGQARQAGAQARKLLNRLVLLYSIDKLQPLPQQAQIMLAEVDRSLDLNSAAGKQLAELIRNYPHSPYAAYARAVVATDPTETLARLKALRKQKLDPFLAKRVAAQLNAREPSP